MRNGFHFVPVEGEGCHSNASLIGTISCLCMSADGWVLLACAQGTHAPTKSHPFRPGLDTTHAAFDVPYSLTARHISTSNSQVASIGHCLFLRPCLASNLFSSAEHLIAMQYSILKEKRFPC